ncbi:MAG TPA: HAMP domain-containing sensor histidine kinase [Nitrososphaeraceae archaeon]|jgi:signal transduction histidine kinase
MASNHCDGDKNKSSSTDFTKIYYGIEDVIKTALQFLAHADNRIDACIDQTRPLLIIDIERLKDAFLAARKRGVRLRYITEITTDNLSYCKQLLTMVDELRHLDGIKGNFYLSDTAYLAPATFHQRGKPASQTIYSNIQEIVEHQRYIFDTLWTGAIPADQRIKQIEERGQGTDYEILQVITNKKKASQIFIDMVKSINKDAFLFLPNNRAVMSLGKLGIVDYLIKASVEKNANIKIICLSCDKNIKILDRISKEAPSIKVLNNDTNSLFTMCIVDGEKLLRTEIRESEADADADVNNDDFTEAIAFAIYSTRKLTVNSFRSIFDLLWNERLLNERLISNDKMQKEFINISAHELRTPIQAILGYSELAMLAIYDNNDSKDAIGREIAEYVAAVHKNSVRLQELTREILNVARIESNTLKLNRELLDLVEITNETITDIKHSQAVNIDKNRKSKTKNNIEIIFNKPDSAIFINADKVRIAEVLSNLITNAIDANKSSSSNTAGRIIVSIQVSTNSENDANFPLYNDNKTRVIVSIKDEGTGIDPEIMPRLFTKFVSNSESGLGLGLYISKNLIESHGGRIWGENNTNGKGATFSFSLPIAN